MSRLSSALTIVIAVANMMFPALSAERYQPRYIPDAAQICIERFEDNGFINISSVDVRISDDAKITLRGGYAGCVFVRAGRQTISLTFPFPYAGEKTVRYWTTPKRNFSVTSGQLVRFELCEDARTEPSDRKWSETGWHTMWLLREAGTTSPAQRCATEPGP